MGILRRRALQSKPGGVTFTAFGFSFAFPYPDAKASILQPGPVLLHPLHPHLGVTRHDRTWLPVLDLGVASGDMATPNMLLVFQHDGLGLLGQISHIDPAETLEACILSDLLAEAFRNKRRTANP